jgi:hypothetical protein
MGLSGVTEVGGGIVAFLPHSAKRNAISPSADAAQDVPDLALGAPELPRPASHEDTTRCTDHLDIDKG